MPVSQKQLHANHQNAQKSSGPKSVEGKEITSRNAAKHGLYSRKLIIDSPNLKENPAEFELLHDSLTDELQPTTLFQQYLVSMIAICIWRSRRALRAEAADITNQVDDVDDEYQFCKDYPLMVRKADGSKTWKDRPPEDVKRIRSLEIERQTIHDPASDSTILRYQMRIDRQLVRAYALLAQLQKRDRTDSPTEILVPVFRCPVTAGVQNPECPAAGVARGQNHPSPCSPLPSGEGPGARDDTRPPLPRRFVETAEEGFERPTIGCPAAGAPPLAVGSGGKSRSITPEPPPPQNHHPGFRQVLPAEGGCDLPGGSPDKPPQNHHQIDVKKV